MKREIINDNIEWRASVPMELHGHRKKLDFFIGELDKFCRNNDLSREQVRVVEVGCSQGRNISLPLAELGYHITGIDVHAPSISWAQQHNSFSNANFVCQDIVKFEPDKKFDVVILSDILEHVDSPLDVLNHITHCLSVNGIVLVCIPNGYGPYENEQRLLRFTRFDRLLAKAKKGVKWVLGKPTARDGNYNYDSGHIHFFRLADFKYLAKQAGLIIEKSANGALFGGDLSYLIGIAFPFIANISLRVADRLPLNMVSTWYFRLRMRT